MGRHVVTTAAGTLKKGDVVELTAAQETAFASSIRAVTARDVAGESAGVSN